MKNKNNQLFFIPLFRLPFRPFFLAAGLLSILFIAVWGLHWGGYFFISPFGGILWWHGHEMIFGFAGAVLVGFLLTAAKNWTGLPGMGGWQLVILFSFWFFARFSLLFSHQFTLQISSIFEALFWGFACFTYTQMIIKSKLWINLGFAVVLFGLGCFSIFSIFSTQNGEKLVAYLHTAIIFFVLVITVIGGRIIPFFSASSTGTKKVEAKPIIEIITIILSLKLLLWSIVFGLSTPNQFLALSLVFLAIMHVVRISRWPVLLSIKKPMLWPLYLGYSCMIIGLILLACYHLSIINHLSSAIHTLTLGSIGLLILAMMSRVSLGHTGRAIVGSTSLTTAFVFILLAMLLRVIIPLLNLSEYLAVAYMVSAFLWVIAFTLWVIKFLPVLTRVRADGKPG